MKPILNIDGIEGDYCYASGEKVENGDFVYVNSRGFDFVGYVNSDDEDRVIIVENDRGTLVYGKDHSSYDQFDAWCWDDVQLIYKSPINIKKAYRQHLLDMGVDDDAPIMQSN